MVGDGLGFWFFFSYWVDLFVGFGRFFGFFNYFEVFGLQYNLMDSYT